LGWIVDLYGSDNDIRACGQTIVYAVHETVGHLGIFVSGGIAKKEHQEFASNIDLIDVLPPGLYEAVMTPKTADAAHAEDVVGDWIVRFEPRTLDDVKAIVKPDPESDRRFATVRRVSEINLGLYRTLFQPFVRASVNEQTAAAMKKLSHAELPFEIFSERNPLMQQVAQLAEQVRQQRRPVAPDNPFLQWQALVSDGIIAALNSYRDLRDSNLEQMFLSIYSSPALQALVGLGATTEPIRPKPGLDPERKALIEQRIAELKARIDEGGAREAAIRALVYIGLAGPGVDERAFNVLRDIRDQNKGITLQAFKQMLREQYFSLLLDRDAALAAIPKMLQSEPELRSRMQEVLHRTVQAAGELSGERAKRLAQVEALFGTGLPAAAARKAAPKAGARTATPAVRKTARKTVRKTT
jgi:hypothetical protein